MERLVIDASSIINFFRYYCFDKNNSREIHGKLKKFIVDKINAGEIVVIDTVFKELREYYDIKDDIKDFKEQIRGKDINTEFLLEKVDNLVEKHRIRYNERQFYDNNPDRIELELKKESEGADLYLVSYCKQLRADNITAIIVTEETTNTGYYRKLIAKIPTICNQEGIECRTIPHALFEIYKDELKFKLEVENK